MERGREAERYSLQGNALARLQAFRFHAQADFVLARHARLGWLGLREIRSANSLVAGGNRRLDRENLG